jgi:hypothetical protein
VNPVDRDVAVARPNNDDNHVLTKPFWGSRRLRAFAVALNRAARDYLEVRGVSSAEDYRLLIEKCPVHGCCCARVTYGMLRDHIRWSATDPVKAAASMLRTMLPSDSNAGARPMSDVARPSNSDANGKTADEDETGDIAGASKAPS